MSLANITTFAASASTYQAALMSLFSGKPEDTASDLSKLFTPTFTMKADNETLDLPTFITHISALRGFAPKVDLTIVQFLRDGNQLAERHKSTTTLPDGRVMKAETFQFAEVAEDGRIAWIVESVEREKTGDPEKDALPEVPGVKTGNK